MPKTTRARIGIVAAVVGVIVAGGAGLTLFGWMIDETHFDRPDPAFDALAAEVAAVPGVSDVQKSRWVEAPLFVRPFSSLHVAADQSSFPALREIACDTTYPDAVMWSVELAAAAGTRVSAFAPEGLGCPDFGFDVAPVASELGRIAPGSVVQVAVWESRRFSLSSLDVEPDGGITPLLPLVANADTLRGIAGVDPTLVVEVASPSLGVEIGPGESTGYHALLSTLAEEHDVTFFSFGGGGTPTDGVKKVQLTAPASQHAAIERLIAASGLPVAALPVSFLG